MLRRRRFQCGTRPIRRLGRARAEGKDKMKPPRSSRAPWTPEDGEQLRTMMIVGRTPDQIAIALGRTTAAVWSRARLLGLSFKRVKVIGRPVELGLKARK